MTSIDFNRDEPSEKNKVFPSHPRQLRYGSPPDGRIQLGAQLRRWLGLQPAISRPLPLLISTCGIYRPLCR
jgi:hypothetical protein